MSRPCVDPAAVGAELLATVAVAVVTLRQHLTDPDPKTALRAVAELTKLLSVCARHGIAVEAARQPVPVEVPSPATPTPEAEPTAPSRKRDRRNDNAPSKMPLPGGRGSQEQMPPGGKRLTSFLGSSAAKQEAG